MAGMSIVRVLFPVCVLMVVLVLLQMPGAGHAVAQLPGTGDSAAPPAAAAEPEKDPHGRGTPQGMVTGLMNALAAGDYGLAVRFFQTTTDPELQRWAQLAGPELARSFHQLLDRAGTVTTPAAMSNEAAGNLSDGLAEDLERFGVVKGASLEVPLLARRVRVDNQMLWLVADSTLRDVLALSNRPYGEASARHLIDLLPQGPAIAGAPFSHWLALLLAAGLSFALAWSITLLRRPLEWLIRRGGSETKLSRFVDRSTGPLRVLITLIVFGITVQFLGVSVVARYRVL